MKKLAILCSAAMVLAGMSTAANAVTIRKAGTGMVLSGVMNTTIGTITTPCTVTATYDVTEANPDGHTSFAHPLSTDASHGHSITLTGFTMSGSAACGMATLHGTPTISTDGTTVTISNIDATAIGGLIKCQGSISGAYKHNDPAKNAVQFVNQTVGACKFTGTLTAQNAGEFDIDATP
ncbi:hypothetical protein [Sphingomonas sp. C3-2]|uniref:hypothetical protein n=1 Tax=Sphingomonas sp. C3-2 TaxID=3062169 RepID=UPI00294AF318|nr:hypothetical protein [Sphingomonas sp. C3-2]WOK37532.1 hypothetical protein QYC26_04920 [Sphingomonas sp. C3-2]